MALLLLLKTLTLAKTQSPQRNNLHMGFLACLAALRELSFCFDLEQHSFWLAAMTNP
jgi:hypothetical protein